MGKKGRTWAGRWTGVSSRTGSVIGESEVAPVPTGTGYGVP